MTAQGRGGWIFLLIREWYERSPITCVLGVTACFVAILYLAGKSDVIRRRRKRKNREDQRQQAGD